MRPWGAFSASAPFTVDFRYAGTPKSVMAETEWWTSIAGNSGVEDASGSAFSASAPITVDFRCAETPESVMAETAW